ncbi:PH domain-containing protein [Streptomyces longisporus]|uniref:Low molecular weight protein antigen 6 PH domain-containing protein n=1 Tax=Streptomyces longisporus TaxID=1948 RepID=A0ABP5ZNK2_STRLO
MSEQDGVIAVWRASSHGLLVGYALALLPAVGAVVRWLALAVRPDLENLASAAVMTAIALAFGLFSWWTVLRVRLELGAEVILMVNPWGTQRLPWSQVRGVTLGGWGAEFHTLDGFKFTASALGNFGERGRRQDERFAGLQRLVESRLADRHRF